MKNKENVKNTFSNIRPSDECSERIFAMTIDNKKANKGLTFKRLVSAALAFALLIGGGFGTNAIVQNNKANQPLGVMVAYADEFMKIESGTKQSVCKSLYFAPADDEEKCREQRAKADKDYEENREVFEKLAKNNDSASLTGVGCYDLYDGKGIVTSKLYTTGAGFFATNKTNYENVKSFTVENESEDAFLQFEWSGTLDLIEAQTEETVDKNSPYPFIKHKFTLTGDELRQSQEEFNKYGYTCEWVFMEECISDYNDKYSKDFDVTSIKDKITFTLEYNDGTTESASVNIGFDSNGHMVVS
ncbi:MAG: hypothetical protein ACI4IL_05640 [Eubacterium sp.]